MKTFPLIILALSQISLASHAAPASIQWCKGELAGGYSNQVSYREVLLCRADHESAYYQRLCFGHYFNPSNDGRVFEEYVALQFNSTEPYSGMWRTSTWVGGSDSEIERGNHSVRFAADQSVLLGSKNISEMVVDFDALTVIANVYEKGFFSRKLLGSDFYTCVRE